MIWNSTANQNADSSKTSNPFFGFYQIHYFFNKIKFSTNHVMKNIFLTKNIFDHSRLRGESSISSRFIFSSNRLEIISHSMSHPFHASSFPLLIFNFKF